MNKSNTAFAWLESFSPCDQGMLELARSEEQGEEGRERRELEML